MLEFLLQQFPFRYGLDEGTDPHQQPPGRLTTLENGEWVKGGRIQKRSGISAPFGTTYYTTSSTGTTTSGSITSAKRLFSRGTELGLVDGSYVYVYSTNRAAWQRVDQVPDTGLTWSTLIDPYTGVAANDVALVDGKYQVHAWTTGDPLNFANQDYLWAAVLDLEGRSVAPPINITSVVHGVRVLASGQYAFVIYRAGLNIIVNVLNTSTMSWGPTATLRNDARLTSGWDAMMIGSNVVIVYENTPGNAIKLYSYSFNGAAFTQTATGGITGELSNDFRCFALDGAAGEVLYVMYCDRTGGLVRIATANPSTMVQVTAPTTLESGTSALNVSVKRIDASNALCGWSYAQTGPTRGRLSTIKVSSVLAQDLASRRGTWGARLISRIFTLNSKYYAFALDYPISASSAFAGANSALVEIETSAGPSAYIPHRYLGKLDPMVGGLSLQGFLPSTIAYDGTKVLVPVPFLGAAPQTTSNWRCGLRLASVTCTTSLPADMWRTVVFGAEAYMAGALLHAFDGRSCFDYGFSRAPIIAETQAASPTAGSIAAGNYLYGVCLEFRSNAGVLHRSPIAVGGPINAPGGTTTITLTLVGTDFTSKVDVATGSATAWPILLAVHRSTVGGSNYYRLTFEPRYNVIAYDVTTASQTLADTSNDSAILTSGVALATRPLVYTTGGILEDEQPPNLLTHTLHKSRLWGPIGDRRTIWYSKSFQDDLGVAPGFSSSFRMMMDEDITSIWSMDEKGIIASDTSLWYILGGDGGPTATGQGSDIQGPFAIQTDVGCTNPRSVVGLPDGTMFECDGRIYLLTRGLEVVWIGRQVQDKLAAFPNITSAVLVPAKNQVRFTCNNDDGTEHTVLVYDYVEKQWTTFRYLESEGYGAIADAIMHAGRYHFALTDGSVYRELDDGSCTDDGGFVPMTLETAWISAAGPLAFQSVRRFALHGVSVGNHDLTLSVGFDRDPSYPEVAVWPAGTPVTAIGPLEAAELHIGTRRKCSSIRFKIRDDAPSESEAYPMGSGQGPMFDSMGIEVGVKKGFQKKPATKRG